MGGVFSKSRPFKNENNTNQTKDFDLRQAILWYTDSAK